MNDTDRTIHLTPDEYAYLMRLLGGAGDQGIKTLGVGLTAVGVLALRDKMERASITDRNYARAIVNAIQDVVRKDAEAILKEATS